MIGESVRQFTHLRKFLDILVSRSRRTRSHRTRRAQRQLHEKSNYLDYMSCSQPRICTPNTHGMVGRHYAFFDFDTSSHPPHDKRPLEPPQNGSLMRFLKNLTSRSGRAHEPSPNLSIRKNVCRFPTGTQQDQMYLSAS